MRNLNQYLLLALVIFYVLCPVDLLPGPVDDLIVVIISAALHGRSLHENTN